MKKLIVVAIILVASICQADVKYDLFEHLKVTDMSHIEVSDPDAMLGMTRYTVKKAKKATMEFINSNDSYILLQDWNYVEGRSYCTGFLKSGRFYAFCIDKTQIVVLKEIK